MPRKSSYDGQERTISNAAQTLLANIRFANVDNPVKTLVVTSSVPNEGKSTISVELARSIARGGRSVLLVECDMRRRSLAAELNLHPANGLYSVLSGGSSLASAAVSVEKNFWFVDVEPHIPNPPEIIASKRFRSFVEEVRGRFNYVIFDTPPLAAFVDAAVLSSNVDGTVMVVRENFARRSEVIDAFKQLESAGANVLGVCMNFCHEERSDYYYAYYDEQGNRIRTRGKSGGKGLLSLPGGIFGGSSKGSKGGTLASSSAFSRDATETSQRPAMPVNRTRTAASAAPAASSQAPERPAAPAAPAASATPAPAAPAATPRASERVAVAEHADAPIVVPSRAVISRQFQDLDEE